jgi:hypothetical protein
LTTTTICSWFPEGLNAKRTGWLTDWLTLSCKVILTDSDTGYGPIPETLWVVTWWSVDQRKMGDPWNDWEIPWG